ncbi:MAG: low molecular weight protein arginine phosphatase [bacterium]
MQKTILFVCTGNSCRSIMAEGLLKKMLSEKGVEEYSKYKIISAGTHTVEGFPPVHMTQKVMNEQDIDVSSYKSNKLTKETVNKADLVLVMTQKHKDEILRIYQEKTKKIFLLKEFAGIEDKNPDIADPIGLSYDAYKYCMEEIEKCLIKIRLQ